MAADGDIAILERHSTAARATAIILCLFAGPIIGITLAWVVARDSQVASFIGFIGLPLIFFGGYKLWFVRIALAVWPYLSKERSLAALYETLMKRRASERRSVLSPEDAQVVAGRVLKTASSFWIVAVSLGIPLGIVFAFVSKSFAPAFALFSIMSLVYGSTLTRLARSGYLLTSES